MYRHTNATVVGFSSRVVTLGVNVTPTGRHLATPTLAKAGDGSVAGVCYSVDMNHTAGEAARDFTALGCPGHQGDLLHPDHSLERAAPANKKTEGLAALANITRGGEPQSDTEPPQHSVQRPAPSEFDASRVGDEPAGVAYVTQVPLTARGTPTSPPARAGVCVGSSLTFHLPPPSHICYYHR